MAKIDVYFGVSCLHQQGPAELRQASAAWLVVDGTTRFTDSVYLGHIAASAAYYAGLKVAVERLGKEYPPEVRMTIHIADQFVVRNLSADVPVPGRESEIGAIRSAVSGRFCTFDCDCKTSESGVVGRESRLAAETRRGKRCILNGPVLRRLYVDESCQTGSQWMAFGGLCVPEDERADLEEAVRTYRGRIRFKKEFKWKRLSNSKFEKYRGFMDVLLPRLGSIHYAAVVFDTTKFRHDLFNQGDRELGFYKFLYQFLLHSFLKKAGPLDRWIVHLDKRRSHYKLSDLHAHLNRGVAASAGIRHFDGVRSIEPLESEDSDLLQLTDVLLGAISASWNRSLWLPGACAAKLKLAEHISGTLGVDLCKGGATRPFAIWQFKLREIEK